MTVLPILSALSDAEGAPVHEQDDGAIRLEHPTLNRQPLLPTRDRRTGAGSTRLRLPGRGRPLGRR